MVEPPGSVMAAERQSHAEFIDFTDPNCEKMFEALAEVTAKEVKKDNGKKQDGKEDRDPWLDADSWSGTSSTDQFDAKSAQLKATKKESLDIDDEDELQKIGELKSEFKPLIEVLKAVICGEFKHMLAELQVNREIAEPAGQTQEKDACQHSWRTAAAERRLVRAAEEDVVDMQEVAEADDGYAACWVAKWIQEKAMASCSAWIRAVRLPTA